MNLRIFFLAAFLYVISLVIIALHSSLAALVAIFPLVIAFSYSYFRLKRFFLVKNVLVELGFPEENIEVQ
jgi:4-hydroxybenzoate polyprenyltransferase